MRKRSMKPRTRLYPTDEEFHFAKSQIPELRPFTYKPISALIEFLERTKDEKDVVKRVEIQKKIMKENDFQSWNNVMFNKLENLKYSSSMSIFYYGKISEKSHNANIRREQEALFFFYSEMCFFLIESVNEVIGQILNLLLINPLNEYKVSLKNIQNSGQIDIEIEKYLEIYFSKITDATAIRNSLAHRYPDTMSDRRIKHSIKDGQNNYGFGLASKIKHTRINPLIIETMDQMKELILFLDLRIQKLIYSKDSDL